MGSGLAPVSEGWFVVNARDAAWLNNDYFGGVCIFESDGLVLRRRPDLKPVEFAGAGFTLRVVKPGRPAGRHCVILAAGNRTEESVTVRPRSELALRYGAGVEEETTSFPRAKYGEWKHEHPLPWNELPWANP